MPSPSWLVPGSAGQGEPARVGGAPVPCGLMPAFDADSATWQQVAGSRGPPCLTQVWHGAPRQGPRGVVGLCFSWEGYTHTHIHTLRFALRCVCVCAVMSVYPTRYVWPFRLWHALLKGHSSSLARAGGLAGSHVPLIGPAGGHCPSDPALTARRGETKKIAGWPVGLAGARTRTVRARALHRPVRAVGSPLKFTHPTQHRAPDW